MSDTLNCPDWRSGFIEGLKIWVSGLILGLAMFMGLLWIIQLVLPLPALSFPFYLLVPLVLLNAILNGVEK